MFDSIALLLGCCCSCVVVETFDGGVGVGVGDSGVVDEDSDVDEDEDSDVVEDEDSGVADVDGGDTVSSGVLLVVADISCDAVSCVVLGNEDDEDVASIDVS